MLDIHQLFDRFNRQNILIIGDVMIDAYLWGSVERISPEAPVPILNANKRDYRPGGAANVALNIQSLGANPILCAVIGHDEKGILFQQLIESNKLSSVGLITDNERITTTKTRIISGTQHLLRVDEESTAPLNQNVEDRFISHLLQLLQNTKIDAIVFEDYDKGVITPRVIEVIVAAALNLNIPTLVDPKKRNFLAYKNVSLFKPNLKELIEGLKIEVDKSNYESIFEGAKLLRETLNAGNCMITLSEKGVLITNDSGYLAYPAKLREIVDVSGAGDTVISVSSLCLAAGVSMDILAQMANIAGGLVCEKVGVVPIDKGLFFNECIKHFS